MKQLLVETINSKLKLVESTSNDGSLATLEGTFAEYGKVNANDRLYEEELWDNVIDSPDLKRALKNKTLYGELDHPSDHMEILAERAAFAITDLHKDTSDNTIKGQYKILDTPAGRILNTLVRFGSVLGVSSRGTGEMTYDEAVGCNKVIPESYSFITFDVVTDPSNTGAIPSLVESVQTADLKELKLIEEMSSKYNKETASVIINKVKERRAVLEDSQPESEESETQSEESETQSESADYFKILCDKFDKLIEVLESLKVSRAEPSVGPEDSPVEESAGDAVNTVVSKRTPVVIKAKKPDKTRVQESSRFATKLIGAKFVEDSDKDSTVTESLVRNGRTK